MLPISSPPVNASTLRELVSIPTTPLLWLESPDAKFTGWASALLILPLGESRCLLRSPLSWSAGDHPPLVCLLLSLPFLQEYTLFFFLIGLRQVLVTHVDSSLHHTGFFTVARGLSSCTTALVLAWHVGS